MPLGMAKDSMLNLAELAHQKEEEEEEKEQADLHNQQKQSQAFHSQEHGKEETLVMHVATHEIGTLDLEAALVVASAVESEHECEEKSESNHSEKSTQALLEMEQDPNTVVSQHTMSEGPEDKVAPEPPQAGSIGDADSVNSDTASELAQKAEAAAGPESEASTVANNTSYGSYSGFAIDYSEYEHYEDYAAYSGTLLALGEKQQHNQPFWCCLFPWMAPKPKAEEDGDASSSDGLKAGEESTMEIQRNSSRSSASLARSASKDEDEVSTGSDILGERLSDKDRQAVLARLRLAQPDAKSNTTSTNGEKGTLQGAAGSQKAVKMKGLLNGIVPPENESSQQKSILKRAGSIVINRSTMKDAGTSSNNSVDGSRRRSLFPSYETKPKVNKDLHVDFSPMARVLTVKSHKDMDDEEKARIWWQRSDYEEFRKTGRMITKAMLEGGSEIWLATNQSWLPPNKDKQSTLKHAFSLAERHAAFQRGDVKAKKEYEDTRDKWWHKFDHSRRGLEHIASIDEGRQRQANVRTAIKAVLDEQRRQKVFHREDPEKLRMVCIQHTSWARDLALAAGASDADAVQMNFDDESRKSREFYLLKFSRSNEMKVHTTAKASVPAFMKPALTLPVQPSRLDANTVPQIRYRQAVSRKLSSVAPAPLDGEIDSSSNKEKTKCVPIKTGGEDSNSSTMAKQAAGFASGEEVGNMSNVLTGMGAISVASVS